MSGPALPLSQIEARRQAVADTALYLEATADKRRDEQRAARIDAVRVACTPLRKDILHGRKTFKARRVKNRLARESRRVNR